MAQSDSRQNYVGVDYACLSGHTHANLTLWFPLAGNLEKHVGGTECCACATWIKWKKCIHLCAQALNEVKISVLIIVLSRRSAAQDYWDDQSVLCFVTIQVVFVVQTLHIGYAEPDSAEQQHKCMLHTPRHTQHIQVWISRKSISQVKFWVDEDCWLRCTYIVSYQINMLSRGSIWKRLHYGIVTNCSHAFEAACLWIYQSFSFNWFRRKNHQIFECESVLFWAFEGIRKKKQT